MGSTLRYLAVDGEDAAVYDWFESLDEPPRRVPVDRGAVLHFDKLGPLVYDSLGMVDWAASPVVTIIPARPVRSVLWTAGEVHFWPTPLRSRFPGLDRTRRQFVMWLGRYRPVYVGRSGDWDHYLEGSIRNNDSTVYAMQGGMSALQRGTYFVADDDNDLVIDTICRSLALRGDTCGATR